MSLLNKQSNAQRHSQLDKLSLRIKPFANELSSLHLLLQQTVSNWNLIISLIPSTITTQTRAYLHDPL